MGFRVRRSIKLGGGVRINFSKSGIGYSWGVPGYRITKTSRGKIRKTYSIPGTGISYVEESGRRSRKSVNSRVESSENMIADIPMIEVEKYTSADCKEFARQISKRMKLNRLANILLLGLIFLWIPAFFILPFIGICLKIYVRRFGRIQLDDPDEKQKKRYIRECEGWLWLNRAKGCWLLPPSGVSSRANDGTTHNDQKIPIRKVARETPFYFKTGLDLLQIQLPYGKLIFLPDRLVIIWRKQVGVVNRREIKIRVSPAKVAEDRDVPDDATIIGFTWLHVNKNGTPDKRYKRNPRLPVCLYGNISIESIKGMHLTLQCSNIDLVKQVPEQIYAG
jgi:hypothetical protein